ncbi:MULTISPECIES: hypothetical protein [unclassified Serratia (in: enterobacteria)]|uniref:hypothetical protein n=1 Tax=unclassified Serratia (in: enterobacteria) TaxID=2647522 RepID=UPI003B437893
MKFEELSEETKNCARTALCSLLVRDCLEGAESAKSAGEYVAAAFIAMEHHDDAPEVCNDGKVERGQNYEEVERDADHDGG